VRNLSKEQLEELILSVHEHLTQIDEFEDAAYLNNGINEAIHLIESVLYPEEHREKLHKEVNAAIERKQQLINDIQALLEPSPKGWTQVEPVNKVFVVRKWIDDTYSIVERKRKSYRAVMPFKLNTSLIWDLMNKDSNTIIPYVIK
jgi:hypothetical protein